MAAILLLLLGLLQNPRVVVHARHLAPAARADLVATAEQCLAIAERRLGSRVERPVQLHVVGKAKDLPASVRAAFHDFTIAIALSRQATVYVVGERTGAELNGLRKTLTHEFVHVVLGELEVRYAEQGRRVPRWLHEGLAQYVADEILLSGSEDIVWFRASSDRLFGWLELSGGFPEDRDESRVAYAQSASFVSYLVPLLGMSTILETLHTYLSGKVESLDLALYATDHATTYTYLTSDWVEYVKGRGLLAFLRSNCFSILIVLSLPLLAIVLYKRFGREKRALRRLEAWEQSHDEQQDGDDE